jgi:hypothetical protein
MKCRIGLAYVEVFQLERRSLVINSQTIYIENSNGCGIYRQSLPNSYEQHKQYKKKIVKIT